MKRLLPLIFITAVLATSLQVSANENVEKWQSKAHDAWIAGKVETTLLLNGNLNSFTINSDVSGGVVTLSGDVDSDVEKALAEELVLSLYGVTDVKNRITVLNADPHSANVLVSDLKQDMLDAKVETVVKTRLLLESAVKGLEIHVDSNNGIVTLEGEVGSNAERDLAVAIVKNTNDVDSVIDKLVVRTTIVSISG